MRLLVSASLLNISFALFSAGIDPEWGAFIQKTEKNEGLQVGSGYGYQKKVSTSLGLGITRGHAGGLRGNVQRRQEVALGIVEGPSEGD